MVQATTTLFFGVLVSVRSLVCATHAWQNKDVWTVDWIIEKKMDGSLRTDGSGRHTTCAELPEEIWRMIRRELLQQVYDCAVQRFVSHYHECGQLEGSEAEQLEQDIDLTHLDKCFCCWEGQSYEGPYLQEVFEQTHGDISLMLGAFDLEPGNRNTLYNPNDAQFSTSCAVTIPLLTSRPGAQPTPTSIAQSTYYRCYRGRVNDTMVLDSSLLDVPEDLTKRFNRLFQTFPKLECDQTPLDSIYLGGQIAQQVPDSSSPRWHLAASVIEE